jgi:hypothetical protein
MALPVIPPVINLVLELAMILIKEARVAGQLSNQDFEVVKRKIDLDFANMPQLSFGLKKEEDK